jgi:hypothetical protein
MDSQRLDGIRLISARRSFPYRLQSHILHLAQALPSTTPIIVASTATALRLAEAAFHALLLDRIILMVI